MGLRPAGELGGFANAIGEALAAPATAIDNPAEPEREVIFLCHRNDMRRG
jgi:hypothetical protein